MRVALGVAVLAALAGVAPTGGRAGAWPREAGTGFASVATHLTWPRDIPEDAAGVGMSRYDAVYLEYGLTDRIVAGLDLGRGVSGASKVLAFLRVPVAPADWPLKIALELGVGRIDDTLRVRPGLGLGYGLSSGWLAADLLAEQPFAGGAPDLKLDLTWGLNLPGERKAILQLQSGQQAGDSAFLRAAPSLVVPLGASRFSAEIGGAWGLAGDRSMGLKLGLWTRF